VAEGSFNTEAAARGETLFNGRARCSTCHVPPIFTEPGNNLHKAADIGIDDFQANRGPGRSYVTSVLRALADTGKIHKHGYYHDGRFTTLRDVIDHYDSFLKLRLREKDKADLIEYLRSL